MENRNYVVISPCRDEAEYIDTTIKSILAQSIRPVQWVIVDDGSTDATPGILSAYAEKHDFIKIVRRENRGHRSVGPGVIEAFYAGYGEITETDYSFLCKLDLDLDLPPRYFEILLNRMSEDPTIGTCSGKPYFTTESGKLVSEKCGDENSVGMTKFYRRECFEQIGGFVRQVMWDAIDGHKCRMLGWKACSWDEPELQFIHLRPMGSSHKGLVTGRMRHGFGQYFMGTGFFYMTASALYRMTRPPILVGGFSMWLGYVKSIFTGAERLEDREFVRYLRRYQRMCLVFGKKRATQRLNDENSRKKKNGRKIAESRS